MGDRSCWVNVSSSFSGKLNMWFLRGCRELEVSVYSITYLMLAFFPYLSHFLLFLGITTQINYLNSPLYFRLCFQGESNKAKTSTSSCLNTSCFCALRFLNLLQLTTEISLSMRVRLFIFESLVSIQFLPNYRCLTNVWWLNKWTHNSYLWTFC